LAAFRYGNTRGVCTLGSPYIGDPAFAAAFNAKLAGRTLRYVNDNDVVTHVPPPFFFIWRYEHVDLRRFITPDGKISGAPPDIPHYFGDLVGHPQSLLEVIEGLRAGTLTIAPTFFLDHMPKAYAIWMWNDYETVGD
jgi:hypothetical protein